MSPVTGATMLTHDVSIVTCPSLGDVTVGGIVAYPEELDRHMMFERNRHGCSDWSAGNGGAMRRQRPRTLIWFDSLQGVSRLRMQRA